MEMERRHNDSEILEVLKNQDASLLSLTTRMNTVLDVMIGVNGKTTSGEPSLVTKVNEMYPVLVSVRGARYTLISLATMGAAYVWLKSHWPF